MRKLPPFEAPLHPSPGERDRSLHHRLVPARDPLTISHRGWYEKKTHFYGLRRNIPCSYPFSTSERSLDEEGYAEPEVSNSVAKPLIRPDGTSLTQHSAVPINTKWDRLLLTRDVVRQHLEAFFDNVYPLGLDFFHRPSMMEEFYAGTLPPILCASISAASAMFVSRSHEARLQSIQWGKEVEGWIMNNLNDLKTLNVQLLALSVFQSASYRQLGKLWLMMGMATRQILGSQLNTDHPVAGGSQASAIQKECQRRLVWHIWVMDSILSSGVDEFVTLPDRWMHVSFPSPEHDFELGTLKPTAKLSDGLKGLSTFEAGVRSYMHVLSQIRARILTSKRSIILDTQSDPSSATTNKSIKVLLELQQALDEFASSVPEHLRLTQRNVFAHSTTAEFTPYTIMHTWLLTCYCELYRITLPRPPRENAGTSFAEAAPPDFVEKWRKLAVSYALGLAKWWYHLQDLKAGGAIRLKNDRLPVGIGFGTMSYTCTKILLFARRMNLYEGIIDPITKQLVELNDEIIHKLCQSNLALLSEMAAMAPLVAAARQDIKKLVEANFNPGGDPEPDVKYVPSDLERDKFLHRHHALAQAFGSTVREDEAKQPSSPQRASRSVPIEPSLLGFTLQSILNEDGIPGSDLIPDPPTVESTGLTLVDNFGDYSMDADYYVPPSENDMYGELSRFLLGEEGHVGESLLIPF